MAVLIMASTPDPVASTSSAFFFPSLGLGPAVETLGAVQHVASALGLLPCTPG